MTLEENVLKAMRETLRKTKQDVLSTDEITAQLAPGVTAAIRAAQTTNQGGFRLDQEERDALAIKALKGEA